jgi:hypothetical protein
MKTIRTTLVCGTMALLAGQTFGCGEDRQSGAGGAGGDGGAATTSTTSTTTTGAGGATTTTTTGAGGMGGGGGGAEELVPPCTKNAELSGEISQSRTLTADTCYELKGLVYVKAPATLTIDKGTKILGDKVSLGTLVIEPGAKIEAVGTAKNPIVFTSKAPVGERAAGDWGGVIVLGKAPVNLPGGQGNIEGLPPTADTTYGGDKADDSSGTLRYVRIEFSGVQLSPNNEVNGLTFGGVGSGTVVDHIMVHDTLDDCFEFFGGTVNAKYLICAYNGDDGFDWDNGFNGKLQFLALQQDPNNAADDNGFEGDNDANATANMPFSEPTIYNATLCGKNADVAKQQYGMLLRRSTKAHIFNTVVTGFEAGVDLRDKLTSVELKSSIFHGNLAANIAYAEVKDQVSMPAQLTDDDDGGLDEVAWFSAQGNATEDPQIVDCFNPAGPNFTPKATLTSNAATPSGRCGGRGRWPGLPRPGSTRGPDG